MTAQNMLQEVTIYQQSRLQGRTIAGAQCYQITACTAPGLAAHLSEPGYSDILMVKHPLQNCFLVIRVHA